MTEGYRIDSWVTGSGFENLGSMAANRLSAEGVRIMCVFKST